MNLIIMKTLDQITEDMLKAIREINQKEKGLIITESNVIDLYKKLSNNEEINQTEVDLVKKRFNELCNYPI